MAAVEIVVARSSEITPFFHAKGSVYGGGGSHPRARAPGRRRIRPSYTARRRRGRGGWPGLPARFASGRYCVRKRSMVGKVLYTQTEYGRADGAPRCRRPPLWPLHTHANCYTASRPPAPTPHGALRGSSSLPTEHQPKLVSQVLTAKLRPAAAPPRK